MEKNNFDYTNFDRLEVLAKKEKSDKIIECYNSFQWKLINCKENERYNDTFNLTFSRPHKISNKDYLQYTQIEMENTLNDIGKLEKNKHTKSTVCGLSLGIIIILLLTIATTCLLKLNTTFSLILGILCSTFAIIMVIICTLTSVSISKKENIYFEKKHLQLTETLDKICNKVKEIYDKSEKNLWFKNLKKSKHWCSKNQNRSKLWSIKNFCSCPAYRITICNSCKLGILFIQCF